MSVSTTLRRVFAVQLRRAARGASFSHREKVVPKASDEGLKPGDSIDRVRLQPLIRPLRGHLLPM